MPTGLPMKGEGPTVEEGSGSLSQHARGAAECLALGRAPSCTGAAGAGKQGVSRWCS